MLTGRSTSPVGFDPNSNSRSDEPSIAAIANRLLASRNNLPPAAVLPEKLVHFSGRMIPGQHAGKMGAAHDPWFIAASPYDRTAYGAYPDYSFDHQQRGQPDPSQVSGSSSPCRCWNVAGAFFLGRVELLKRAESTRAHYDQCASLSNRSTSPIGIVFDDATLLWSMRWTSPTPRRSSRNVMARTQLGGPC